MKIAIMADIHSNIHAFRTCLQDAINQGVSEFLFLGDYLGDMANPRETLRLLGEIQEQYPCTFIRGNKEEYWICHRKSSQENWISGSTTTGMLLYNYQALSDQDIDFMEQMPISQTLCYDGLPAFTICHGSPFLVNQSMRPDYNYIDSLCERLETDLVICGHFHMQLEYVRKGKKICNPGAVGVPLHSEGRSQYMILQDREGAWEQIYRTLDYDVNKTIQDMDQEKLYLQAPGWYQITKYLLLTGKMSHAAAVNEVLDRYEKESGIRDLHRIPEELWKSVLDDICQY